MEIEEILKNFKIKMKERQEQEESKEEVVNRLLKLPFYRDLQGLDQKQLEEERKKCIYWLERFKNNKFFHDTCKSKETEQEKLYIINLLLNK